MKTLAAPGCRVAGPAGTCSRHRAPVLGGRPGSAHLCSSGAVLKACLWPLNGHPVPLGRARRGLLGDPHLLPHLDSLVENGEVKFPAQAADDSVIGHTHGKVVIVILGEGDGVGTLAGIGFLQEELQSDMELALVVLHNGQICQVRLEKPVQGLQLVGIQ